MKLENPLNLSFENETEEGSAVASIARPASANDALERQLNEMQSQLEAKDREISKLKTKNQELMETSIGTRECQKLMEKSLRKAEAQIELIMELMEDEQPSQRGNDE